jgi:hypothetical protein
MDIGTFVPVELYAGNHNIVTDWGTHVITAAVVAAGTVLGKITKGTVAAAVAAGAGVSGANTGNGTCVIDVTTPKLAGSKPGTYHVAVVRGTATTVMAIGVLSDPDGNQIATFEIGLVGGTATTVSEQIKFAIKDGSTPFVAGDGFDIVIAAGSGYLQAVDSSAVDGSESPYAVLIEDLQISAAVQPCAIALCGEFNENALVFGGSDTISTHRDALRKLAIYAKSAIAR